MLGKLVMGVTLAVAGVLSPVATSEAAASMCQADTLCLQTVEGAFVQAPIDCYQPHQLPQLVLWWMQNTSDYPLVSLFTSADASGEPAVVLGPRDQAENLDEYADELQSYAWAC